MRNSVMKNGVMAVALMAAGGTLATLALQGRAQQSGISADPPSTILFYGGTSAPISAGVAVPPGRALLMTSGTVPSPINPAAKAGTRERYGDTYTQAKSILKNIESQLAERGLTMRDVIYLRAYLVADPTKENKPDFKGWFDAYGEYFANAKNKTRTARSTVAVSGLVDPGWLIEIEAVAAYPEKI